MSFSTTPSLSSAQLILASGSGIRRSLLDAVGLTFEVRRPSVDEEALKRQFGGPDEALAILLAEAKATQASADLPEAIVVGADSIAVCEGRRFDKPRDRAEATEHLRYFSGRVLSLVSAVALAKDGVRIWREVDRATLLVRNLGEKFITHYLDVEWPEVGQCAGVFRMEGRGATLFEEVTGNHFTILGLPLLPLLGQLRELGMMAS